MIGTTGERAQLSAWLRETTATGTVVLALNPKQWAMVIAALDFSVRRSEVGRKAGKASIARLTKEQHRAQAANGAKVTNRKRWGTP